MERLAMVEVALVGLLFGACAGRSEPESVEDVEQEATSEKCEKACGAASDQWTILCGALPPSIRANCHSENNEAYGACKAICDRGKCDDGCDELDTRWKRHCKERIPGQYKLRCETERPIGKGECTSVCLERSLDRGIEDVTGGGCMPSQNES
jgi:hypothetical protein